MRREEGRGSRSTAGEKGGDGRQRRRREEEEKSDVVSEGEQGEGNGRLKGEQRKE